MPALMELYTEKSEPKDDSEQQQPDKKGLSPLQKQKRGWK